VKEANWADSLKEANRTHNVKGANSTDEKKTDVIDTVKGANWTENTKEANGTGTQNKQMGKKTRINKVKATRKKDVIKIL
jgi:hypothetical protein